MLDAEARDWIPGRRSVIQQVRDSCNLVSVSSCRSGKRSRGTLRDVQDASIMVDTRLLHYPILKSTAGDTEVIMRQM